MTDCHFFLNTQHTIGAAAYAVLQDALCLLSLKLGSRYNVIQAKQKQNMCPHSSLGHLFLWG